MVQTDPEDEFFIPDKRLCVTVMNGKTDMLVSNHRYSHLADLSLYVADDENSAAEIAKNLGIKVLAHHRDINYR